MPAGVAYMLKANFLFAISSAARSAAGEARRMLAKAGNRVKAGFQGCQHARLPFRPDSKTVYDDGQIERSY